MAVCALFYSSSVMAEEIIWQEDWSSVTEFKINPENFNPNYTFTGTVLNDDGSFKSGTTFYEEALAGGEAPELLIAKNGGSFAAKVALNGVSGQATLAFKCNKTLEVSVNGATLGAVKKDDKDFTYPVTIAAGTSEITITFTMSGSTNARIDNIKLYLGEAQGGDQPDDNAKGQKNNPYTVAEALEVIAQLGDAKSDHVYAKGIVTEIVTEYSEEYGNVTFAMSDDAAGSNRLEVFRCKNLNNEKFTNANQLAVGDEVVVYGQLVNYQGKTPEFTSGCYLISTTNAAAGIKNTSVDASKQAVYNLAGQRLTAPKKGVNITAGKKYMVK